MVLFHLFFLFCTTIRPKIRSLTDLYLLFAHDHSTKIYDPLSVFHLFFLCAQPFDQTLGYSLIYFFHLYTTIQPKLGRGHSNSLIYSFLNCTNISFAIFMTVMPLYYVRSIPGRTAFIFRPLYS